LEQAEKVEDEKEAGDTVPTEVSVKSEADQVAQDESMVIANPDVDESKGECEYEGGMKPEETATENNVEPESEELGVDISPPEVESEDLQPSLAEEMSPMEVKDQEELQQEIAETADKEILKSEEQVADEMHKIEGSREQQKDEENEDETVDDLDLGPMEKEEKPEVADPPIEQEENIVSEESAVPVAEEAETKEENDQKEHSESEQNVEEQVESPQQEAKEAIAATEYNSSSEINGSLVDALMMDTEIESEAKDREDNSDNEEETSFVFAEPLPVSLTKSCAETLSLHGSDMSLDDLTDREAGIDVKLELDDESVDSMEVSIFIIVKCSF
jgi:hypothetical protein